mmetsp:Transcript_10343/g.15499  ORF Transcript_10343/g.15499 Transcript_10343/m.15499 type:complete len:882 (+) Transcript_10343:63-2708(+)
MESIYPSETVRVDEHDDDVSTLSGSSYAPQSPKNKSRRVLSTSPQKSKTKLQPYLNGTLPVHVSAALKRSNAKEDTKKGIPTAIKISVEDAISASCNHSDDERVSYNRFGAKKDGTQQLEANDERVELGKENTPDKQDPHSFQQIDGQLSLEKTPTQDSSPTKGTERNDSRFRSPVGNETRRQRVLRLRLINLGDTSMSSSESTKSSAEIDTTNYANMDGNIANDKTKIVSKAKYPPQESTPRQANINLEKKIDSASKEPSKSSVLKASSTQQILDDILKSSVTVTLSTPKTSRYKYQEESLMDKTPQDDNSPQNATSKNNPNSTSSSFKSPNKDTSSWNKIEAGRGRIHRSFWSVPAQKNYNSSPFSTHTHSTDASSSIHTPTRNKQARLAQLVKEYDSPTKRFIISRPSGIFEDLNAVEDQPGPCAINEPGPCTASKVSEAGNNVDNSPSRESAHTCSSKSSQVSHISNASESLKSFDDFYDDVIRQLKCNVATCADRTKEVSFLNAQACTETTKESMLSEPPMLKRLMLDSKPCICDEDGIITDSEYDSESDSDESFDTASEYSSIDTDLPKDGGFEIRLKKPSGEEQSFAGQHSVHTALKEETEESELDDDDADLSASPEYQAAFNQLTRSHSYSATVADSSVSGTEGICSIHESDPLMPENDSPTGDLPSINVGRKSKSAANHQITEIMTERTKRGSKESTLDISVTHSHCDDTAGTAIAADCCISFILPKKQHVKTASGTTVVDTQKQHTRTPSGSTIDTNAIFSIDELHAQVQCSQTLPKPNRKLRNNVLSTPTHYLVKKIRRATHRVRNISHKKKKKQKQTGHGDGAHLLSATDATTSHDDYYFTWQNSWLDSSKSSKYASPNQPEQKLYSNL